MINSIVFIFDHFHLFSWVSCGSNRFRLIRNLCLLIIIRQDMERKLVSQGPMHQCSWELVLLLLKMCLPLLLADSFMALLLVPSLFQFQVLVSIFRLYNELIVNEISPTELKGPLGTLTQILITVGIMISYFLGLPIPDYKTSTLEERTSFIYQGYWRVMFALPLLFAAV